MTKRAFILALLVVAASASSQAPSDHSGRTATGVTFTVPEGWTAHGTGSVVVLDPPEADTHIAIVDVAQAADAKSAAAAAWELYRAGASHPFKLLTTRPPRNGWDEQALVAYETSPNEHLDLYSVARRKGGAWTVVIIDGSESTTEKRAAAVNLIVASMRPAGYTRKSFADRTAHPLDAARIAALIDFVRQSAAELDVPGVGLAFIDQATKNARLPPATLSISTFLLRRRLPRNEQAAGHRIGAVLAIGIHPRPARGHAA